MNIVLFSALFGDREPLNPNVFAGFADLRRVIVSDRPRAVPPGVELMLDDPRGLDPARASRRPKLLPHLYFPDADWSIWLDNKSRLLADPAGVVAALAAQSDAAFFAYPHFRRDCVYDEARTVLENGLDDHRVVEERLHAYRREGMPRHFGLIEGHFIVRRHHDSTVAAFGTLWFDHVCRYSRRDQVSFPYLAWKTGFTWHRITRPPRAETVRLNELDRASRPPEFPRRYRARQALRVAWHRLCGIGRA